ncbi:MAG TPA: histidine phosphatase family protein [Candidatus Tumulicola sp.]
MIVLCRHGETDANAGGAFLSASDPPLNATGTAQVREAARTLRDIEFDVALTSPKLRCRQTCAILAPAIEAQIDDRLIEVNFGTWDGRSKAWLEQHEGDALRRRSEDPVNFRPPSGESFADAAIRIRPLADRLREDCSQRILVVAHRGTLGVLERLLRGLALNSQAVVPMEPGEFRTIDGASP